MYDRILSFRHPPSPTLPKKKTQTAEEKKKNKTKNRVSKKKGGFLFLSFTLFHIKPSAADIFSSRCDCFVMSPQSTAALVALLSALSSAVRPCAAVVATPTPTTYVRRTYTVDVPFFTKYWWVGFIIMFLAFLLIVLVLYVAVQCHFKEPDQRRRRKEVEASQRNPEVSSEDEEETDNYGNGGRAESINPLHARHR